MFIPIGDENPRETTPYVNYSLLAINIAAFVLSFLANPQMPFPVDLTLIPAKVDLLQPASWFTIFTSMFLHASILHIAGNMLFLWIFGDNVEDKLGHIGYLFFYLLCGVGADVLHIATTNDPTIPTLGASGAISGVIGAYVLFFPRHKVKMLIWIFIFIQVLRIPAWVWIGIWFLQQALMAGFDKAGGVAYFAHIGGFLAGLGLAAIVKFLVAPGRFKYRDRMPEEITTASRWGDRSRPLYEPLITVEEDDGYAPVDTGGRFAVLRMEEELSHIHRIAAVTSASTGEPAGIVSRRLNATRGMIAKNLPRAAAERINIELRKADIRTIVVPYASPPAPLEADRVIWDDTRIGITVGNEAQPVPWMTPYLYVAAMVLREPVIDIHVTARHVVRVTPRTIFEFVDAAARRQYRMTVRDFAQAVIERRHGAAINDGIRVLAHRGSWGWLQFADPADYEDYSFWLSTLLLSRRPAFRYR